jgi:membrane fusion protein (multidrug efflux system)
MEKWTTGRKMLGMILVTGILSCSFLNLPSFAQAALPGVEVLQLQKEEYTPKVYASGKIEAVNEKEITSELPVIPEKVYVNIGDEVKAGDVLAKIDIPATVQAMLSLSKASEYLPEELTDYIEDLDLEELSAYIPREIVATGTGVVSAMNLNQGSIVYPTETAAVISQPQKLRVCLSIPEEYADEIELGQRIKVKVNAAKKSYSGEVSLVFPAARSQLNGTSQETVVDVYGELDQIDKKLKSGYSVTGEIFTDEARTLPTLPYQAIGQDDSGQEYVYVYQNGRACRKDVETGEEMEEAVEICSGLTSEDYVIADCSSVKADGSYVTLLGRKN